MSRQQADGYERGLPRTVWSLAIGHESRESKTPMESGAIPDARSLLVELVGRPLQTLSGRPNRIVRLDGADVVVATGRSPGGAVVPIAWVQDAIDLLAAKGELRVDVDTVGHRSAFVGAVLRELPGTTVLRNPQRVALIGGPIAVDSRARELARREAMWTELVASDGPDAATPQELRRIGIYGGAGGVWVDKSRTAEASSAGDGVAVSVLHTGRHYPDDLSETAMLYHYLRTGRPASRDRGEIDALKACLRQRLPLFVITETDGGRRRAVHRGWVEEWDDASAQILVSFDREAPARPALDEEEGFELYTSRDRRRASVVLRPNQQRFKLAVLKRYGSRCAMCQVSAPKLIKAAHLVAVARGGSDHPGNGLPLCANHHDALDGGLVQIRPETLELVCAGGYDAAALGISESDLRHLRAEPHPDALRELWRRGGLN